MSRFLTHLSFNYAIIYSIVVLRGKETLVFIVCHTFSIPWVEKNACFCQIKLECPDLSWVVFVYSILSFRLGLNEIWSIFSKYLRYGIYNQVLGPPKKKMQIKLWKRRNLSRMNSWNYFKKYISHSSTLFLYFFKTDKWLFLYNYIFFS